MTEQKILPAPLDRDELLTLVRLALDEDLRYGPDITSTATVPADAVAKASVVSRSSGTVAGIDVGLLVLDEVIGAGNYEVVDRVADGTRVAPGQSVLTVVAPTRGLLTAERTMLNLVCHLSGIATATSQWVDAIAGTHAKVRDSRKTLPDCVLCRNMQSTWAEASTTVWDWVTRR